MTGLSLASPRRLRRRGSVLIVALGILAVLALLAVSFATVARTERRASTNYADSVRARLAAEAGIEVAIRELRLQAQQKAYTDSTHPSFVPVPSNDNYLFPNVIGLGNSYYPIASDEGPFLDYTQVWMPGASTPTEYHAPRLPSLLSPDRAGSSPSVQLPWEQVLPDTSALPGNERVKYEYEPSVIVGELLSDNVNRSAKYMYPASGLGANGDTATLRITDSNAQIHLNMPVAFETIDINNQGHWDPRRYLMGEYEPLYSMMVTMGRALLDTLPAAMQSSPLHDVAQALADCEKANASGADSGLVGVSCNPPSVGHEVNTLSPATEGNNLIKAILERRRSLPGGKFTSKTQLVDEEDIIRQYPNLGQPVPGRAYGRLFSPDQLEAASPFLAIYAWEDSAALRAHQHPSQGQKVAKTAAQIPPYGAVAAAPINMNEAPYPVLVGAFYGLSARTFRYDVTGNDDATMPTSGPIGQYARDLGNYSIPNAATPYSGYGGGREIYELLNENECSAGAAQWRQSFARWAHPQFAPRRWQVTLYDLEGAPGINTPWGPADYDDTRWIAGEYSNTESGYWGPNHTSSPDYRLSICNTDVGPLNYDEATQLAELIVWRRTRVGPFRTYGEVRRFLEAGDAQAPNFANGIQEDFTAVRSRTVQHLVQHGYSTLYVNRVKREMIIDMLMANISPNVVSRRANPDSTVATRIEKGDLLHYTTEFSFGSGGVFEIESLGRVTKLEKGFLPGEAEQQYTIPSVVAKRRIRQVVRVFNTLRVASQREFESLEQGNVAQQTSPGFNPQKLAWPSLGTSQDSNDVTVRRESRRWQASTFPQPAALVGASNTHDTLGWIAPLPAGTWFDGYRRSGLGNFQGGWSDKFGLTFDWADRDLIDDLYMDNLNPENYLNHPGLAPMVFHGIRGDSEDLDNYEFCIYENLPPTWTPYAGDVIDPSSTSVRNLFNLDDFEVRADWPNNGRVTRQRNALSLSWFDNDGMGVSGVGGTLLEIAYPSAPSGRARKESFAWWEPEGLFTETATGFERSQAHVDGFFCDNFRRGNLFYWASGRVGLPTRGGGAQPGTEFGFAHAAQAAPLQGQLDWSGPNDTENVHRNLSFRDGAIEFWVKLDLDGSDPVPCGFFSSIQVTNSDEKSQYSQDAVGEPTGGIAMYVFKDPWGYLRISRIYYEKAFSELQSLVGRCQGQPAPWGDGSPMCAAAASPPVYDPDNDPTIPGHADGWNLLPRSDVIYDISEWRAHTWHHVAIGWKLGTVLYECISDRDSGIAGNPYLYIDGRQDGNGSLDIQEFGPNNGAFMTFVEGWDPNGEDPFDEVVTYCPLNVTGPFDHMTVGSVVRREFEITDGVFKFFSDSNAAGLDGGSRTFLYSSAPWSDYQGPSPYGRPEEWDCGRTAVLPLQGTIDDFHTYPSNTDLVEDPGISRYSEVSWVPSSGFMDSPPTPTVDPNDPLPEFQGVIQFPDTEFTTPIVLGTLSWSEARPTAIHFDLRAESTGNAGTLELATVSPYQWLANWDEACQVGACGSFSDEPIDWPDAHVAYSRWPYDPAEPGLQPRPGGGLGFESGSSGFVWVRAAAERVSAGIETNDDAQTGCGGPVVDPDAQIAESPIVLQPGDAFIYRILFSTGDVASHAPGNACPINEVAAVLDVRLTYLTSPVTLERVEIVD